MVIKLYLVNIHLDQKEESYFPCDYHVTEVLHSLKESGFHFLQKLFSKL